MNEPLFNPEFEEQETKTLPKREDRAEPESTIETPKREGDRRRYLNDAFETLFRAEGGSYAQQGEEDFSGDAASIYVMASLKNDRGEEIPELVKVGWGEFSKKTFEGDRYPAFRDFPFDIYCVSQEDSYFADEKLRREMTEDPKKFLSEHSLFVASNGRVQRSERVNSHTRRLDKDIKPVPYDEMLRSARNQIIVQRTAPGEFAAFLRELPDDPAELGKYITDLEHRVEWMSGQSAGADEKTKAEVRKRSLLHIFWGMGMETVGIAVGNEKAMDSLLALKKQFDFETNTFR